ncbi:substrate-binding domain-containing protein [Paenibacillus sp. OK003]|uniref:sugar ABC transporter substrate-binding protein n=1 Tax=Paenibacillus sp. OK003 TaxID=1884380 RepID=UPI0008B3AC4F|nr:substrate-binding domain-containing protein [Paenibacillus sp. OK003]SEK99827.1 ribose transport system substrate-binding protein [Paenibacillus sp. OK003]
MNKVKSVFLLKLMLLLPMVITSGSVHMKLKQQAVTMNVTTSDETSTDGKTFGIIYPMTYPTYEMITMDATESAGKHNITLMVNAPDEANTEQQIRIMENMIKQNVDGIAISPVDATALTPAINKAQAAGIPVITFESDAPSSNRTAYVGADNYRTGRQFAMTTTRLLNNQGMILVENGLEEMHGLQQRLNGFIDYIRNETAIEILEIHYNQGNEDQAMTDMENMIDAHPHFNAIIGLDFVSVSASTLIWKAKGLKRHLIALGDSPTSENGLLNGQLSAVISQNEGVWGAKMIETLLLASEGLSVEELIDTGITELNQEVISPCKRDENESDAEYLSIFNFK